MSKKYLITGGLGFLGAALARAQVHAGHTVRIFDNGSRGANRRLGDAADSVEVINGDIRDPEIVKRALKSMDAVCHLAFVNGTRFFYERPAYVLEVGVKGMMNVLDGCLAQGIGELILASSSEVYQTPPVVPTSEEVPLVVPDPHNPRFSYGGGKIISELLAINYGRADIERVVIFRPHNVYGPDMGWEHVIPEMILRMRELASNTSDTIQFPIQGTGEETRAFIHIDDFTDGLMRVIAQGEHLGIYHIGTQDEVTVATVAREIGRFFGREISIVPGELRAGGTQRRCPDISKLETLGFSPKVALTDGIALTSTWYDQYADKRPVQHI